MLLAVTTHLEQQNNQTTHSELHALHTDSLLRCDRVPGNDSKQANSLTRLELTNEYSQYHKLL